MTNVIKYKSLKSIEWNLNVQSSTDTHGVPVSQTSQTFFFQGQMCNFKFSPCYDGHGEDDLFSLYFESDREISSPVTLTVRAADASGTFFSDTEDYVKGKTRMIWSYEGHLQGDELTFYVVFFEDSSIDIQPGNIAENDGQLLSLDSETNTHLKTLSKDFLRLLDEGSEYDVEIKCEDKTFKAHRNILGTRSAVFSAMFKSNMVEGETGLVIVKDFEASTFQSFLRYLYSGILPEMNMENVKEFFEIGDKYAVEELQKSCSEFLVKNMSGVTACEILILADQHNDQDFRKNVISYIVDKDIPKFESCWPEFCKAHPLLANEVMLQYIRKIP